MANDPSDSVGIVKSSMFVVKRGGRGREEVKFDKITERLKYLTKGLDPTVSPTTVAIQTIQNLHDMISTTELDLISAKIAEGMKLIHPDYGVLASRILVSNLHKSTPDSFSACMETIDAALHNIDPAIMSFIRDNATALDKIIIHANDYNYDYLAVRTLERSYLHKIKDEVCDRPQYMYMRVAIQLWMKHGIEAIKSCYRGMSNMLYTHATPTLYNASSRYPAMISCFDGDMEVCTLAGVKKIKDVTVGDAVVTHTNTVRTVSQLHTNPLGDRDMYDLTIMNTPNIMVTGNHKVWAMTKNSNPEWVRVDQLIPNIHFVGVPNYNGFSESPYRLDLGECKDMLKIPHAGRIYHVLLGKTYIDITTYKENTIKAHKLQHRPIRRYWSFDEDTCRLVGIFYGDGHIMQGKNKKGIQKVLGVGFTCGSVNNNELIEFIKMTGEKVFGIPCVEHKMSGQNVTQLLFTSYTVGSVFNHLFGKYFDGKRLWNKFYSMGTKYVEAFMAGLISTDGCVSKEGTITVQMTNPRLVKEIYHLCRTHGIVCSYGDVPMRGLATADAGRLCVSYRYNILKNVNKTYTDGRIEKVIGRYEGPKYLRPTKNQSSPLIKNGNSFLRVASVSKSEYRPEFVYTLGVDTDHSYNIEGILAENCYLTGTDDSIEGIMKNLTDVSLMSKRAGGIGIHMSNIRPSGAYIHGTNGKSSGLVKQLQMYNAAMRCWDQGGRRAGSCAIYLEPWHYDVISFLEMRLPQGEETERCRDLFSALWIPDLFIRRAQENADWSLFGDDTAPGLNRVYDGQEVCRKCGKSRDGRVFGEVHDECTGPHDYAMRNLFTELYTRYEREGRAMRVVKARTVMDAIFRAQRETGMPYVCFKDHINRKSNQANVGPIESSNLCAEIVLKSSSKSYANCTLASVSVRAFWTGTKYDYQALHNTVRQVIRNLDETVDSSKYPVPECVENAQTLRPVAIGIQGLADLFCTMRIPFTSAEAEKLDYAIAETIYHAAIEESCERAERLGAYPLFRGSPMSDGLFQFDLWKRNLEYIGKPSRLPFSGMYDWESIRQRVVKYGLRNSKLVAYMPTVSTAQIMGNNESFEPFSSNLYTKTSLGGKFTVTNQYMIRHLMELGLWNDTIRNRIITANGSLQSITEIPESVREIYRLVWEIPQSELMRRSAMRSAFIDQSSSLNLHIADNSNTVLRRILVDGWALGHKTNSYYIRTRPASSALKNNIAASKESAVSRPTIMPEPVHTIMPEPASEDKADSCGIGGGCSG